MECPPKCIICLEPFTNDNGYALLECAHVYHPECITQWFHRLSHPLCPICRLQVNPKVLHDLGIRSAEAPSSFPPPVILVSDPIPPVSPDRSSSMSDFPEIFYLSPIYQSPPRPMYTPASPSPSMFTPASSSPPPPMYKHASPPYVSSSSSKRMTTSPSTKVSWLPPSSPYSPVSPIYTPSSSRAIERSPSPLYVPMSLGYIESSQVDQTNAPIRTPSKLPIASTSSNYTTSSRVDQKKSRPRNIGPSSNNTTTFLRWNNRHPYARRSGSPVRRPYARRSQSPVPSTSSTPDAEEADPLSVVPMLEEADPLSDVPMLEEADALSLLHLLHPMPEETDPLPLLHPFASDVTLLRSPSPPENLDLRSATLSSLMADSDHISSSENETLPELNKPIYYFSILN